MAVSLGVINAIGQTGSFISSYLWGLARDTSGSYRLGIAVLPLALLLAMVILLVMRRGVSVQATRV